MMDLIKSRLRAPYPEYVSKGDDIINNGLLILVN
jgi:hypothetical protein